MSEGDAILRDIIANPDDDGLRLIYADWLEDNGHSSRAELIRVQIEFAGLSKTDRNCNGKSWGCFPDYRCRGCQLREREAKVLPFVSTYTPYVLPDPSIILNDWEFRRGFIHTVRCDMQAWLDHGKDICAMHPVERLEIIDRNPLTMRSGKGWWCHLPEHPEQDEHDIPLGLWGKLAGHIEGEPPGYLYWKIYRSDDDAHAALSHACLAHARQLTQSPTAKV